MTQLLHQCRIRRRGLAQGLLLVLLATWLAAVCPHCLAEAADVPEPTSHCHEGAPAPVEPHQVDPHDCGMVVGAACAADACAQLSVAQAAVPDPVPAAQPPAQPLLAAIPFEFAWPVGPPPAAPLPASVAPDSCPVYLRHCTFLN